MKTRSAAAGGKPQRAHIEHEQNADLHGATRSEKRVRAFPQLFERSLWQRTLRRRGDLPGVASTAGV